MIFSAICVEQYVKSIPNRKVLEHTPDDVLRFFSVIGGKSNLKGWQFYQQVEALQILFCHVLKTSWCHQIDWNYWYASAKELQVSHPTIARESTSCTQYDHLNQKTFTLDNIRASHSDVFSKIINEIRRRHYSIRTEQSYTQWVARYIAYHQNKATGRTGSLLSGKLSEKLLLSYLV